MTKVHKILTNDFYNKLYYTNFEKLILLKFMLPPEHWKNLSLVDIEGEEWKDVVGWEGLYQISNMGRVKSLSRWRNCAHVGHFRKSKIMKIYPDSRDKYLSTILMSNDIKIYVLVHRLVATAFVPNPLNLPQVNHKFGITWDNRASELEWMTKSQNIQHAFDTGLKIGLRGEKNGNSKLTQRQVDEIRAKYIPYIYTKKMLAKEYKINIRNIAHILDNEMWII